MVPIVDPTAHKARITLERRSQGRQEALFFSKYCHMYRECFCASAVSLHVPFSNASDVIRAHHGPSAGPLPSCILVFHWKRLFTDAHNTTTTRLVTVQLEFWTRVLHAPELFSFFFFSFSLKGVIT